MTERQVRDARMIFGLIVIVMLFLKGEPLLADEIEIRGATSITLGDYVLKLDGKTTVWIDTDDGSVRVGKPKPPDDPPPKPPDDPPPVDGIGSLEGVAREAFANLPDEQRETIAGIFGKMKIGADAIVKNERQLQLLTNERLRVALKGTLNAALPGIKAVYDAANALKKTGAIATIDDWAAAWKAVAKGAAP